jgi:hypothetical protein
MFSIRPWKRPENRCLASASLCRSDSGGTLPATSTAPLLLPSPHRRQQTLLGKVPPEASGGGLLPQRSSDPSSSPLLGGVCAAGSGRRRAPTTLRLARRPWCRTALGGELLRWSCGYGMGRRRGLSARRGRWIQAVALGRARSGLPPAWWDAAHAVGSGQILLGSAGLSPSRLPFRMCSASVLSAWSLFGAGCSPGSGRSVSPEKSVCSNSV